MKIRGDTVGTTAPRPDYNQNNPRKADYIKNRPIPVPTAADNGKIAMVVDGKWAAVPVLFAEEVEK